MTKNLSIETMMKKSSLYLRRNKGFGQRGNSKVLKNPIVLGRLRFTSRKKMGKIFLSNARAQAEVFG